MIGADLMTDEDNIRDKIFAELNKIETELIALKDVMDIVDKIPIEHPTPVYLVRRMKVHTARLDKRFKHAWSSLLK